MKKNIEKSPFVCNGASNHSNTERADYDYYATPPFATELLLQNESFQDNIWEPFAGEKAISKALEAKGYQVYSTDIIERSEKLDGIFDILSLSESYTWEGDVITNPPYDKGLQFVEKILKAVSDGSKVAMFLKITFLEGKERKKFYQKYPPKTIYISSSRIRCAKNGRFDDKDANNSAVAYAWYVWEKGFQGNPVVKWFN